MIADKIAKDLHNDGQCWANDQGRTLNELVYLAGAKYSTDNEFTPRHKHTFKDDSSIVDLGEYWCIGIPHSQPDCFCCKDAEIKNSHYEYCPYWNK